MNLRHYLDEERRRVDQALERALGHLEGQVREALADPIRHGLLSGGKRLRPILMVEAWRACGGPDLPEAYDLAVPLEMIHAYSLMHDDLPAMDDAELRRGRPTTHRIYGEGRTMEAGAALIPLAGAQLLRAAGALGLADGVRRELLRTLMAASGAAGMVGGQFLDLEGEGMALAEADLNDLHRRKTGALLTAPLVMGGLAAGAEPFRVDALGRYGRAVGLAFQVADDILDATSDAEALGKNPSDAALDKSTYVSLFGLQEARNRARVLVEEALGALDESGVESPALRELARFIVDRDR